MNYTVCWKYLFNVISTIIIRDIIISISRYSQNEITKIQSAGNQRRNISSLVGTSETIRVTASSNTFGEWIAGIIDGAGCLQVSKKGHATLEIYMGIEDLPLLRYIQNKLGGNIKLRSGAKAYRYRLHNKKGMIIMINHINGNIRHPSRLLQLHRVCQRLTIPIIESIKLTNKNYWFAGFFDANGTVTFSNKDEYPQLIIQVISKNIQDVQKYKEVFGGNIHFNSGKNGYYEWSPQTRENSMSMVKYFHNKCKNHKSNRFYLISDYY